MGILVKKQTLAKVFYIVSCGKFAFLFIISSVMLTTK